MRDPSFCSLTRAITCELRFEEACRGEWDSMTAYAEDFTKSTGLYDLV